MRLKPPKFQKQSHGVPITLQVKSMVIAPKPKKQTASWWVVTPAENFYEAAKERDRELQFDPVWKKPENLKPIGQP